MKIEKPKTLEKRQSPGRKGYKIPQKDICEAIKDSAGLISVIAERLGIRYDAAKRHIQLHDSTIEAYNHEVESKIDIAEKTVDQAIQAGDVGAAKWLLSTLGKKRGFSEKQEIEHTGKDGAPIEINVNFVRPNGDQ